MKNSRLRPRSALCTLTTAELVTVTTTQYVLKSGWEIVMTPVTYRIVGFLKRSEQEDYFDRDTDFTPFALRVVDTRLPGALARFTK